MCVCVVLFAGVVRLTRRGSSFFSTPTPTTTRTQVRIRLTKKRRVRASRERTPHRQTARRADARRARFFRAAPAPSLSEGCPSARHRRLRTAAGATHGRPRTAAGATHRLPRTAASATPAPKPRPARDTGARGGRRTAAGARRTAAPRLLSPRASRRGVGVEQREHDGRRDGVGVLARELDLWSGGRVPCQRMARSFSTTRTSNHHVRVAPARARPCARRTRARAAS